ncbi:hypothetical protein Vadar_021433 [Vaccinium darrowii]|uniref:Uncharacterized protein n=1 Tax=Vaccinium darrowii TaxID=229202 RepID=A0ACB7Z5T1_9ERIC|nr:hypothetical protein Vadar_021433 [Vaccinium darrowii]
MSSSSNSSRGPIRGPLCYCGFSAIRGTSWTPTNPSRRFYACHDFYVAKTCDFFEWLDDKICERGKMVILPLRNENIELRRRIAEYEKKIADYKGIEEKLKMYEAMELKVNVEDQQNEKLTLKVMEEKMKGYEQKQKLLCKLVVVVVLSCSIWLPCFSLNGPWHVAFFLFPLVIGCLVGAGWFAGVGWLVGAACLLRAVCLLEGFLPLGGWVLAWVVEAEEETAWLF